MNINATDLTKALKNLNSDIVVHSNSDDAIVYQGGNNNRTGIFFKGKHICNVERNDIPEYNQMGGYQTTLTPVSVFEGLLPNNHDKVVTRQILLTEEDHPMIGDANEALGAKLVGQIWFGGYEVMAERRKAMCAEGTVLDAILLRIYLKPVKLPHTVEKIGWRETLSQLIKAKIPGITPRSLSKELGVDLVHNTRTSEETISEMKQKVY